MNEGNENQPGQNSRPQMMPAAQQQRRQQVPMLDGLKHQQKVLREQLRRIDAAVDALENNPIVAEALDALGAPLQ